MPNDGQPVRLAWVLADSGLRHVSDFAPLAPGERPAVRCPLCREPVTLKLGVANAHHAAHRPDSGCPAQTWETALHLNTKHHVASALRAAAAPDAALVARHRCAHRFGVLGETVFTPGLVPCTAVRDVAWLTGWDDVRVEVGLSDTRPDVLLLRAGEPVAALEIRRTHAVTAEKVERLAALGMPWAEVAASRALYAELTAWTIDVPLTVARTDACAQWWCPAHRPRSRRVREGASRDRPWAARVVDRYVDGGRVVRDVVFVTGVPYGTRVRAPVLRHRAGDAPIAELAAGPRDAVLRAAHAAFLRWSAERRAAGERVDSPMSWTRPAPLLDGDGNWVAGTSLFPQRLRWDRAAGRWLRDPVVGAVRWTRAGTIDGNVLGDR